MGKTVPKIDIKKLIEPYYPLNPLKRDGLSIWTGVPSYAFISIVNDYTKQACSLLYMIANLFVSGILPTN